MDESRDIVIVGVCGAGKSVLAQGLCALGYPARACAQEHSCVPNLWAHRGRPAALIYLKADLGAVRERLDVEWDEATLCVQRERLAAARANCDILIDTGPLTVEQVLASAVAALRARGLPGTSDSPIT